MKEKKRIYKISIVLYIILMSILFIVFFKKTFATNDKGILFRYSFNMSKFVFALFASFFCGVFVYKRRVKNTLTDTIILILEVLYFIPGFIFQAVTDMAWPYIFFYFMFYVFMITWSKIIKPQKSSPIFKITIRTKSTNTYINIMTAICILVAMIFVVYDGGFSFEKLMYTFNNVYEVRSEQSSIHWILVNFEYWACYMGTILITYHIIKKNYLRVIFLGVAELALFTLQGNRIFVFVAGIAVVVGFVKLSNKSIIIYASVLATLILIECLAFPQGGLVTDVFRRYAVSTNRISEQFFDYFLVHEPDFLRLNYSRILTPMGLSSPYEEVSIAKIIGNTYYGWNMGANTGMVGGSFGALGYISLFLSTFGYILTYRLFEGVTYQFKNTGVTVTLSIILATLSINCATFLANLCNLNYFLLMYISLALMTKSKEKNVDVVESGKNSI